MLARNFETLENLLGCCQIKFFCFLITTLLFFIFYFDETQRKKITSVLKGIFCDLVFAVFLTINKQSGNPSLSRKSLLLPIRIIKTSRVTYFFISYLIFRRDEHFNRSCRLLIRREIYRHGTFRMTRGDG